MKRDLDLVRLILIGIEEQSTYGSQIDLQIEGYSHEQINYHVIIMDEAGLIRAEELKTSQPGRWKPLRLTWDGHELLEASRDETRWNKAKEIMATTGGFVFELAKPLLVGIMKEQIQPYFK
jgi:DNA-binding transcriptional ArsR family regulator